MRRVFRCAEVVVRVQCLLITANLPEKAPQRERLVRPSLHLGRQGYFECGTVLVSGEPLSESSRTGKEVDDLVGHS